MDAKYLITFEAPNIPTVRAPMGQNPPKLTGGDPLWEIRERPKRPSITVWNGRAPVTQDIPLLFNGILTGETVEAECNSLDRMRRGLPPPLVRISGAIMRRDIPHWVITSIAWGDDVYKEMRGGVPVRIRQDCVVTVMEYIAVDLLDTASTGTKTTKAKSAASHDKPKHSTHIVKQGETLSAIALAEYGSAAKWTIIREANNIRDPNKLTLHTTLKLPDA